MNGPMSKITVEMIRQALARPLPGAAAQVRLSPAFRVEQLQQPPVDTRNAGVLIVLYPHAGELYFPLTRRTDDLAAHKGQISLPGGSQEEGESLRDTALRETAEEIGVYMDASNVLGHLSTLYVQPSRFLITPYVAALTARPDFRVTAREVAELIEVPLAMLLDPQVVRRELWTLREIEAEVPFFQIGAHKVWGATAMVLSEFAMAIEQSSDFAENSEV